MVQSGIALLRKSVYSDLPWLPTTWPVWLVRGSCASGFADGAPAPGLGTGSENLVRQGSRYWWIRLPLPGRASTRTCLACYLPPQTSLLYSEALSRAAALGSPL